MKTKFKIYLQTLIMLVMSLCVTSCIKDDDLDYNNEDNNLLYKDFRSMSVGKYKADISYYEITSGGYKLTKTDSNSTAEVSKYGSGLCITMGLLNFYLTNIEVVNDGYWFDYENGSNSISGNKFYYTSLGLPNDLKNKVKYTGSLYSHNVVGVYDNTLKQIKFSTKFTSVETDGTKDTIYIYHLNSKKLNNISPL